MSEIIPLYGSQNSTYSQAVWNDTIGKRSFELSNHLGNVLTVISDKPIPVDDANDSDIDWFLADIRQSTDYSGFGVQLENRNLLLTGVGEDYSLGFQGQFEDDEIKGEGNSVNYTYRMHDPRLGRFFAIDPLADKYPHNSPYAFSENIVINAIELEGLEVAYVYNVVNEYTDKEVVKSHDYDNLNKFNQRVYRYYNSSGEIYKELVQKLDKDDNVVSSEYDYYGQDGNPITKPYLLSHSTIGEKETPWYEKGWMADGGMEGSANCADGQKKPTAKDYKYAATMVSGILSIGTGGGSLMLGAGGWQAGFAITGIINATDDMTGLASSENRTAIQNLLGDEVGTAVKLIGSFTTSRAALTDALNNMSDVEKATMSIVSAANDQGQVVYGIVQVSSNK